jgi:2-pyrone-4,6-dicarboxylate lactonase
MSTPRPTFNPHPSPPALALPAGACDTHFHIFGPGARFPYDPSLPATPVDAPKELLFALHRQLGITCGVLVQSTVHGYDLAVLEDFLLAGQGRYRAVALLPLTVTDAELQRLHSLGVRGARFHFMRHLKAAASPADILAFAERLATLGWHLQMHFESSLIHELAPMFRSSPVPVVIDHMARVDANLGADHADFRALRELVQVPHIHVKLSGIDRIDSEHTGTPPYAKGAELAALLLREASSQCLWGTDWPHPNHTHVPDDGVLVDALARIAPTPALLQALLVDNPRRFYGFGG